MEILIRIENAATIQDVLGSANRNATAIEKQLNVEIEPDILGISVRGSNEYEVKQAGKVLEKLTTLSQEGITLSDQLSAYLSDIVKEGQDQELLSYHPDWICLNAKGKPIMSKTQGQSTYIEAMKKSPICFGVGPAGTGKTYLAVAMAVQAFRKHEVDRIILTRPAVEAGERLGFLPGDLQTKVDPYMRPIYDALQDLMGAENYLKNMEKGLIEVSPLAYMRGRTLDNAYIILDEAQNTTVEQMKMFLTRIGFDSRVVVTGDITQIDLPRDVRSGLVHAKQVLRNIEGITFVELTGRDIVRNPIVQRIVKAYDSYEENGRNRKHPENKVNRRSQRD